MTASARQPTEREKLKERLDALNIRIQTAKYWGALLTALEEERQGILRSLSQ